MDAIQQPQDSTQQPEQSLLLPNATPTFTAPTDQSAQQPPVLPKDAGWDAFVANHADPANQNDTGWNSFVAQNADKATTPSVASEIGTGIADVAHVENAAIQSAGGAINSLAADMLKSFTTDFKVKPGQSVGLNFSQDYKDSVSQGMQDFRNSKGFTEGASKFGDLVSDILAPSAEAFLKSSLGQQTGAVVQQVNSLFEQPPKDEYGNQLAWSPEQAIDRFMSAMVTPAALTSIVPAGQVQEIAQPIGQKLFPNDPQAQQDFAFGVGQGVINITMAMEGMPAARPPALIRADHTSVLTSEDAYFNEPLKPEPTPAQHAEAVAEVSADTAQSIGPKPAEPAAPKTINDVVRANNPTLFNQYDEITSKQERLRGWISDLTKQRGESGDVAEIQGKIDILLSKVNGVEDRLTNKQASLLEDLRDQLDDIKSKDTPDMALVRQQLQKLDEQKRDMAEDVSAEYRKAQEQMPKKEAEPVAPPIEVAANEAKPETEAQPQELKLGSGEQAGSLNIGAQLKANEPPKAEVPKIDIAADVSKKLIAAGRSPEEAQANGAITAQIYKYFADAYGGAKGSAEDWYQREGAIIAKHREKVKQLAQNLKQGVKGRYEPATAVSKAIIRLMKRADASTFMHESAHHYLDMMSRFAQEDGAPEKLKADFAEIRNWLGKETGEFSGFTERQHESFARGFERYLHEGVAPTAEMAGVFAKFKEWMFGIYQTAKSIPNQKIEINDNIRNVFDRMLGGKGDRQAVIAPELPLKAGLKDNIKSPALKKLFGSVPTAPKSLTEWLAEKGGLKDNTGDLKAMDADKAHIDPKTGKAKPYAKRLIKDDGMSLDDAARAAHEAGYFPEKGGERPTTAELLLKIREDLHGNKQFSEKDHEELNNHEEALKYNAQVDQIAHETGIDPTGKTHDEFWDAVAEHYNAEKHYNEAQDMAEDARVDYEKYQQEQEKRSANSGESASEEQHATEEDLENARKQEIAAHDAARGTANAERPQRAAGVEGLGEAGVRQGGGGIEPSGRDGEATTASGSTSTEADGGSAGEAGGDAAGRADAKFAGYTAGERTNGSGAHPAGAESYYVDKGGRFRLDKFNTSHDAMAALKEMVGQNNDFMDARYGTDAYKQAQLVRANKALLAQLSEEFVKARAAAKGSPEDMLKYLRISEQMQIAGKIRAELQSDWAHAGHALREVTSTEHVEDVAALVKQVTKKTLYQLEEEANMMGQIADPEQKAQFAQDMRSGKWRRFEDGTLAYFRNAILSNPKTHAAYLVGNYVWAMTRAIATKGIAALLSGGKNVPFGEVKQAVYGIHTGAMNALPIAAAALRSGVPFMRGQVGVLVQHALGDIFKSLPEKGFDFGLQEENLLNAARKEAVESGVKATDINPALALTNADKGEALAQKTAYPAIHAYLEDAAAGGAQEYRQSLPGKVGRALTVPERSMAAIHTISYAMNFEMEIASEAYRNAVNKGLDSDAMNIAIAKFTQNPPVEVMSAAHEQSLRAVFMSKPTYGGMQWIATRFVKMDDVPVLRVVAGLAVPFAQIGMNILEQGFIEHTPLGFLSKQVKDDLLGKLDEKTGIRAKVDPVARDMAHAKMIVGSSAGLAAIALNQMGFITGGGPSDPKKRAVLEATGWKPYSLKAGDLYIPYKRWLGPMGPLMGAASDLGEAGYLLEEGQRKNAAIAISAGFGENIADETWMNGLSNLVQASRSEASAWKFVEETATGFVPYSAALNEVAKQTDPTARLTRSDGADNLWGLLPKVQARLPGLSYMLPAKVDVFGDPIPSSTGIGISVNRGDPVVQKLAELGAGISQIQNKIRGVQLSNEQYNDYAVTAGVLVKENLTWLVQDPEFDKMTHTEQTKEIGAQVKQARHAAQQDMLYRYPELQDKANDNKENAETN